MDYKPDADALVIADTNGNYYVLPRELLEVSRIDQSAKGQVDEYLRQTKASGTQRDDEFGYLGAIVLPAESKWTHFTPSVAWPNGVAQEGRQHPQHMVMVDKPVVAAP